MKILVVSATPFEIAPLRTYLHEHYTSQTDVHYVREQQQVHLLVTGVGMTQTALHLSRRLSQDDFQLVVNAGVAGAFDSQLSLGEVVHVVEERYGDLGVEEQNGDFTDVFEMELIDGQAAPFQNGVLYNEQAAAFNFLPKVRGLTVNKVHGNMQSIARIRSKYHADVESMEGAAFFQTCLVAGVPFLEIRAISNYVEPRNRANWKLAEAIAALNESLIKLLQTI